jgi:hypothetical protein
MVVARATSRSGATVILVDGRPLQSTYDPRREAGRFAQASTADMPPAPVVVLIGAPLPYLHEAIAAARPSARCVRILLHPDIAAAEPAPVAGALRSTFPVWHPGLGVDLPAFLRNALDESDALRIRVLEWPAGVQAFPEQAAAVRAALRDLLRTLRANYVTTAAFGRLWVRNALANFVSLREIWSLSAPLPLLVIAASGPSLADALPHLSRVRQRIALWALPSAVRALAAAGLAPDLVVLTDPGLYATQHLVAGLDAPIAMPLSAARGSWRFAARIVLFHQAYIFERRLAALLADPALPAIAPQGTVAASALALALATGHRRIVFAGLDFCYRDVLSHARPSLVEAWHLARASRLRPYDSTLYADAADVSAPAAGAPRVPAALESYARWFASAALPPGVRVHRLFPSPVALAAIPSLSPADLDAMLPPRPVRPLLVPAASPAPPDRVLAAVRVLAGWQRELAAAGPDIDRWPPAVAELCHFLDLKGYAAARSSGRDADATLAAAGAHLAALEARVRATRAPQEAAP